MMIVCSFATNWPEVCRAVDKHKGERCQKEVSDWWIFILMRIKSRCCCNGDWALPTPTHTHTHTQTHLHTYNASTDFEKYLTWLYLVVSFRWYKKKTWSILSIYTHTQILLLTILWCNSICALCVCMIQKHNVVCAVFYWPENGTEKQKNRAKQSEKCSKRSISNLIIFSIVLFFIFSSSLFTFLLLFF